MARFDGHAQAFSMDDEPTPPVSRDVVRIDPARLRAAIEKIATGEHGGDPRVLLAFIEMIAAQASGSPSGFEAWLPGRLVVEVRRARPNATLHVLGDDGERFVEVFDVELPWIAFDAFAHVVERHPELAGPAVVHVDEDAVAFSVVTYLDEHDALAAPSAPPPPSADPDLDATIVAPPDSSLLRRSVDHEGDALDAARRRFWR